MTTPKTVEQDDGVIIYQLEKVNQGGEIYDLFEGRLDYLAKEWGYELTEDGDAIILPDGRKATLEFKAVILDADRTD